MSDWDGLNAQFVMTLREQKTEPVPAEIVRLAQQSYDGVPHPQDPGSLLHAMQLDFSDRGGTARAIAFEKHMRNAGPHTKPPSSITVVRDPQRKQVARLDENGKEILNAKTGKPVMEPGPAVNPNLVAWRAGARRGRAAA